MNLTEKLIQFDKTNDTDIFTTKNKYTIVECWGICIELFSWLKLEHKRYIWKKEGRPTSSKPLKLHPEATFTKHIVDFIENDDVFKHSLQISGDNLYFSDEISEDEIQTITKIAFDYYNPEPHYN